MNIRKATKKDLDEIARLSFEYGQYGHKLDKDVVSPSLKKSKEIDSQFMELGTIYFILEEEGKILGVQSVNFRKQGNEKKGVLHTTIITKDSRGKGYGDALVSYAISFFKRNGCKRLDTFVHFKNKNAKKFWEKQGFEMEHGYSATKNLR
jgi:L-amino acid N-acyltransferase YncA